MIQLPENFETYAEARKAGFLRMKQLKGGASDPGADENVSGLPADHGQ